MDQSIILVLTGGIVSLVSTLAGLLLQHVLERRKLELQAKAHPTVVVYNKQTEFFERLNPILNEINGFITTLNVWLGETSPQAPQRVEEARENTSCLTKLENLTEQYFVYLPSDVLSEINDLSFNCMLLSNSPSIAHTDQCIEHLFAFQNKLRHFVGTDQLSQDLLKAFTSGRSKKTSQKRKME
jgi:hypothetical protein